MGVVYQAHDPQIDRSVALKVLRQDRLTDETFVQRFLREAKAIGRLSHSNIVTVFDAGQDQGTIYIAMEFVEGEPLHKIMELKKFPLERIIRIGIQVAETLDYAHRKGIVHRDVKPSNIIVQFSGEIKITDFGIAHIEDPSASLRTQAGEILGTPAYMSPEQVMGRSIDGRSDLFSLGIILYEMVSGKRPFVGDTLTAIFHAITHYHPPEPAKINVAIPQGLSKIIMRCLSKTPEKRYESGRALAEAMRTVPDQSVSTRLISPVQAQRRKKIFFILPILLVCLLGVGGISYHLFVASPRQEVAVRSASLKIESSPLGAQVFVDGLFRGQTPLQLWLPTGKHEVRLALPDHYDWEAQVRLKEEGETPLLVRLMPSTERKP